MNKLTELHGGKLKYYQWAKTVIQQLDNQMIREGSEIEKIQLSGYISGVEDTLLLRHKEAIALLLSIKEEISEMKESDPEFFDLTIIELTGYLEGIELVLNQNRYMFSEMFPAFLLVFSKDEGMLSELKSVLHNKFDLCKYEAGNNEYLKKSTALFTSSENEAIEILYAINREKVDVLFSCIYSESETEINTFELNETIAEAIYTNTIILKAKPINLVKFSRHLYGDIRFSKF